MKTNVLYSGIFIIITIFFVCSYTVNADELENVEAGIQISPNRFDFGSEGGKAKDVVVNVHNYDDFSHDVEIVVEDFFVVDDTMKPQFYVPGEDHTRKAYDVINWIEVPDNFTLEGNGSKDVYFKINIPENQPTAGYYGAIFFKTRAPDVETDDENGGTGAKIKVDYRVGTLLTFAVQGDEPMKIDGYVEEFDVIKKVFWESPMTLFAKLHSSGNVHYSADGKMQINKFGKKFAIVYIESENLYPDRTRTFTEQVQFGPWDYGMYSATLDMQSEDGTVMFQDEIPMFFVIPWKTTVIIGGIALLIISVIYFFQKWFKVVRKNKSHKENGDKK